MDQPSATDFHFMINPQSKNAEHVANWISDKLANSTDPASKSPGAPPLYGNDTVPHLLTFQSLIGTFSRAYTNPDEAVRDSIENAHLMEKDVGLLESVECRQRLTALLDWEIKPEDEKCQYQVSLAQELQRIVSRIRNFTKYRMWLMKAIWYGKSGIQHKYGYTRVNGAMRLMPTPLHRDHNGWTPVNGDKLVFRYEDGMSYQDDTAYPHQMGIRVGMNPGGHDLRIHRPYKLEPVYDGLALFLKQYERDTFIVHKHMVEDASFHHSYFAGSIHGVGIRSKIYWEWFLKQEAFAFLMQYLERSAGGIEVWTYPMGDPKALAATQKAAREKMANGRNVVFFPKPMGDDSDTYKFEVIEPGAMGLDIMQGIIENYFGGRLKRYILGQELSTEAKATGMGSGVAEAHMDTLSQIVSFDARNLEETLTHELVRYIQQLNFPETMGWHMRMSLKTEDDKTQERMEALNSAYQMGARIAESEVFKTLGLSAPTSGEKILSMQSQQPAGIPGMPGIGGIPDGDNSGGEGFPEGGNFPDQENGDNPETDEDGEPDPVDLIRSMLDQYAQKLERDRYMTQGMFHWEESLHPRETSTDTVHKAGQFTSKKKSQQKTLFDSPAPAARQSSRFSGKPRSSRKALNDRIRSLFAEHAEEKQGRLNFDDPIEDAKPEPVTPPAQESKPSFSNPHNRPLKPVPSSELFRDAADEFTGMKPENVEWWKNEIKRKGIENIEPPTLGVTGDNKWTVINGRHRATAAKELGHESIPAFLTGEKKAPEPTQAHAPKRRMMGGSADSMKAVAQPAAPPVQPKPQPEPQDNAVVNLPLDKRGSGSIDQQIDRWKDQSNADNKAKQKSDTAERKDDKAKARDLFQKHAQGLAESTSVKHGVKVSDALKHLDSLVKWEPKKAIQMLESWVSETTDEQADPPSVETVPQPTNQPAAAAQETSALKSAPRIESPKTQDKPQPVDESATMSDTERRNKLVEDNMGLVDQALRITLASEKGFLAKRDMETYRSEAQFKLLEAASTYDPGKGSFASYALKHMTDHGTKNLGRRKLDRVMQSATDDGEGNDLLSGVASRSNEATFGEDEKTSLDKAISSLDSDADQWLVRTWFTGEDPDGNPMNQTQAAEAYNQLFGTNLTRQAINTRAGKIIARLKSTLVDPDQYSAVRNMVIRYYRNEILNLQKERYERRQDRVIREAAEYTETDPSDAQIKAGNYKKGRFNWNGMTIVIENPRGSTRRGISPDGSIWRSDMNAHYGYISGTEGSDGDQVDIFMGKQPESDIVFVVHQCDADGKFDEHKVVAGCVNEKQARQLYLSHYPKGWKCGNIVPMTVSEFKSWIESGECCQ